MNKVFPVKRFPDGRAMLNLGCGTIMDWRWNNLDFSYYTRLAPRRRVTRLLKNIGLLSEFRYQRVSSVDPDIISWDLRHGIPFPALSFDVLYHSHVLEHIDRDFAAGFIRECYRVLKPGGVLRVVVPDLEQLIVAYSASLAELNAGAAGAGAKHEAAIGEIFEQMVRRDLYGANEQRPMVRTIERFVRGDPLRAGEAHRWMYDRHSLAALLTSAGFNDIRVEGPSTSRVADWPSFELDGGKSGESYKPGSLYVEATR